MYSDREGLGFELVLGMVSRRVGAVACADAGVGINVGGGIGGRDRGGTICGR